MKLAELVDTLIHTNIEIWHKDTLVRTNADISLEEKAKLFLDARVLNSQRNDLRDSIDICVGHNSCSSKVNYHKDIK